MNHPTFEATFTSIAKGLPDLERVVARIHAKNCRIKDFIRVLDVNLCFMESMDITLILNCQAFTKLSRGMVRLADESESFESKTIFGLLRGAPDLFPNVKHIREMFKPVDGEGVCRRLFWFEMTSLTFFSVQSNNRCG